MFLTFRVSEAFGRLGRQGRKGREGMADAWLERRGGRVIIDVHLGRTGEPAKGGSSGGSVKNMFFKAPKVVLFTFSLSFQGRQGRQGRRGRARQARKGRAGGQAVLLIT